MDNREVYAISVGQDETPIPESWRRKREEKNTLTIELTYLRDGMLCKYSPNKVPSQSEQVNWTLH